MSYGILLWGNAVDLEFIFVLQKRTIRSIYNLGSRESLRERFKEIGIMTVACQYIFNNIIYIRINLNAYKQYKDVHNFNTRHNNRLPSFRLQKVLSSFLGVGIRFFNKIPNELLDLPFIKFKTKLIINK